jgi:hypothetical protein
VADVTSERDALQARLDQQQQVRQKSCDYFYCSASRYTEAWDEPERVLC